MSHEPQDFVNQAWTSTCCGMPAWGEVFTDKDSHPPRGTGICAGCKDHAEFECEDDELREREFTPKQQAIIDAHKLDGAQEA